MQRFSKFHAPKLSNARWASVGRMSSTPWTQYLANNTPTLLHTGGFVNNEWISSSSNGSSFAVLDPATRETIVDLPDMNGEDTANAIDIAVEAQKKYKTLLAKDRCSIVRRISSLIQENSEELAHICSVECGKPLFEARGEVGVAANIFSFYAEEGTRAYGDIIPTNLPHRRILVTKEPVGVCGVITPWNFPVYMIARKLAPALAVGCAAVVKPAPDTPLSALAMAAICHEAGLPPGVVNVLPSSTETSISVGTELSTNKKVRKLTFTGSTRAGIALAAQSASTVKRVSLELGGHAPFIVFDDADIDAAVAGAIPSKFRNAGQTCVCTNRFYVHERVYNEFSEKLAQKTKELVVGHGFDADTKTGPLINDPAIEKIERHVQDAIESGGELLCGGERIQPDGMEGAFYAPTVISNPSETTLMFQEETFGPVAGLVSFSDDEEVVMKANDTDSGLAAYFYTTNLSRAFRVSEQLEYGMVGVNAGVTSTEIAPFGGVKFSGIGREGSKYGIEDYLSIKYTSMEQI